MAIVQSITFAVRDQSFVFRISNQLQRFGAASLRHLRMPLGKLYGPTPQRGGNAEVLVECFWALCLEAQANGEQEHADDRETYLLARLLPFTLRDLAAKVMPDRGFGPTSVEEISTVRRNAVEELEQLLRHPAPELPDLIQFRDDTHSVLGMPTMEEAVERELYGEISTLLLHDAAQLMHRNREEAARLVRERWEEAKRRWYAGRRWTTPQAKTVLSAISYECRAALYEAYSDVWECLLREGGPLCSAYGLGRSDLFFLSLWHVLQKAPSDVPDARFDLFHGHLPALHPAFGLLTQTETGGRLLGELIQADSDLPHVLEPGGMLRTLSDLPEFRRLLWAARLAVYVYSDQRQNLAAQRSVERPAASETFEAYEARLVERNLGRSRRAGPAGG